MIRSTVGSAAITSHCAFGYFPAVLLPLPAHQIRVDDLYTVDGRYLLPPAPLDHVEPFDDHAEPPGAGRRHWGPSLVG